MALSNIIAASKTITYNGESFDVRGLCFDDITETLLDHEAEVEEAFALFDEHKNERGDVDVASALPAIVRKLPVLVSSLVARAAGEPDAAPNFAQLPMTLQLDATIAVWNLTFTEPDSLKKFLAQLTTFLQTMKTK